MTTTTAHATIRPAAHATPQGVTLDLPPLLAMGSDRADRLRRHMEEDHAQYLRGQDVPDERGRDAVRVAEALDLLGVQYEDLVDWVWVTPVDLGEVLEAATRESPYGSA